jgi:uncharacterized protein YqeY
MVSRSVFILLLTATSSAMGAQANMGNVSVDLPPPQGFCELLDSNPSDARLLAIVGGLVAQGGNKLLSVSADCNQLADMHSGQRKVLDDYAQYQAGLATLDKAPQETIAQACASGRKEIDKALSDVMPDIKARAEAALKNVKVNQMTSLGVLAEEPRACYGGLLQQVHTEARTDKTQLCLFALTVVKNRSVFIYRYSVHTGSDSVIAGLAKLKADVAALYAAN